MIYSIYKITNKVNNKVYIGFTQDTERRWKQHINDYVRIKRPLYESMKKHGTDNFIFEVIYQSDNREHTLTIMEPYFIDLYDSYNKGYNCNKGGLNTNTDELCKLNSERMKKENPMFNHETRKKVSKSLKGRKTGPRTILTKEKIKQGKLGEKNPNYGNPDAAIHLNVKITCEHCQKIMNKGNYIRWHGERCCSINNTIK